MLPIFAARTSAIVIICLLGRNRSAPPIGRSRAGARHVFSLGFGQKPVRFSNLV
jgi:hypothetical protein